MHNPHSTKLLDLLDLTIIDFIHQEDLKKINYEYQIKKKGGENKMDENESIVYVEEQLSMRKVLLLVFIPAILLLVFFLGMVVLLKDYISVYLCLLLALVVTLVPFEIAILGISNKKKYGKFGFKVAFRRHEPMSIWKIILKSFLLFAWAGFAFTFLQTRENFLMINSVFKFVPDFLYSTTFVEQLATFPKWIIALTCIVNLIFNGLIGPIVEELYFRGYLMSRMERFGKATPFIIAVLFSVYHLFTPWENITRIIAVAPYHYYVWKDKNLYIGILVHCACNMVGAISLFSLLFT